MTLGPIQRVLVCPLHYSHRQEGQLLGFREAFAGRAEVREFDFMGHHRRGLAAGEVLLQEARDFSPDWIWLQVQGSGVITGAIVERIRNALPRCLITHWMGDARLTVPQDLAQLCKATHATLISSTGQFELYRAAGAQRVDYVQIGLDWDEDVIGRPAWEPPFRVPEVVFCGGHYGHVPDFKQGTRARIATISALMRAGVDVGVVGRGWPAAIPTVGECHVKQQHHVYRRAKVALSINHFNDIARYYSDRHLIAMASGTPVVAWKVPDMELEFTSYTDCLFASGEIGIVDQVKWLLANRDKATAIGAVGRAKVIRDHTWTARIRELAPKIDAWRQEDCRS